MCQGLDGNGAGTGLEEDRIGEGIGGEVGEDQDGLCRALADRDRHLDFVLSVEGSG